MAGESPEINAAMSIGDQLENAAINIKTIRMSRNIAGLALSNGCNLRSAKRVSEIEEGRGKLTLEELIAIADFLDVSMDGLLKKKAKVIFE